MTVRRPPQWVIPASLALVAVGLALLVVATASSGRPAQPQAAVAAAMVLFGGILIGMPLVTGLGRLARRLPIAGSVVARQSTRQSVKATPAIAELIVVLVGSMAAATAIATNKDVSAATGQGDLGGDQRFVYAQGGWDENGYETDPGTLLCRRRTKRSSPR